MLSDPLSVGYGATLSYTGGVVTQYQRIGPGRFVSSSGAHSADQLSRINIRTTPKTGAASVFSVAVEKDKNVAALAGVPQKDATQRCEVKFSGDLQYFTESDVKAAISAAAAVAYEYAMRIVTGEN